MSSVSNTMSRIPDAKTPSKDQCIREAGRVFAMALAELAMGGSVVKGEAA